MIVVSERRFKARRGKPDWERIRFAGQAIQTALLVGLKREPCEWCGHPPGRIGKRERVVAHHDSYFLPLQVRWLCMSCHKVWHHHNGHAPGYTDPITLEEKQHWLDELRRRYTRAA